MSKKMQITDEMLDAMADRVMELPGMNKSDKSYPLIELDDEGKLFMKFMSEGGTTDAANGQRLENLLSWANVEHEFWDERKFFVGYNALDKFLTEREKS